MHKNNEYRQKEKKFMDNIRNEYSIFKSSMLLKEPREIYNSCNLIYFYECMYEYFQYNENVNSRFINLIYDTKNIISELKYIYDKMEYLTINTWSGIDNVINCYMEH